MLLFKSLAACLGEIVSTIFRAIISSASSRPVHWLIGRPDVSGSSQASASSWHRWSAVIRAGPPGRGRSSNRSSALNSSSGIGSNKTHLSRHCLTVRRCTPTSRAIAAFSFPSAANRIIFARLAICCRVLWGSHVRLSPGTCWIDRCEQEFPDRENVIGETGRHGW